jgi:hypothetical protein
MTCLSPLCVKDKYSLNLISMSAKNVYVGSCGNSKNFSSFVWYVCVDIVVGYQRLGISYWVHGHIRSDHGRNSFLQNTGKPHIL